MKHIIVSILFLKSHNFYRCHIYDNLVCQFLYTYIDHDNIVWNIVLQNTTHKHNLVTESLNNEADKTKICDLFFC